MITADQLTARYSRALALTLCQELHATEAFADFCIRYMRHPDPLVARNALCVLTKAGSRDLLQLQPLTDDLILLAMTTTHPSVRRLSLSLVERLPLHAHAVRPHFLDFCLSHMTDVQEPPGIQSLCMKLAFRMCRHFPPLMCEFRCTLEAMDTTFYLPAVKSIRSRILNGRFR